MHIWSVNDPSIKSGLSLYFGFKFVLDGMGTLHAREKGVMSHYQTPEALRHDARTLAEDARALYEATAELTDEKISGARKRLADALDRGRGIYSGLQEKAVEGAKAVDGCVRDHPYQSIAMAFGVGALLGILLSRRN
jgi:ElaB/YqjD/DUF883 family membrane-anchored ribosome-binding protein